MYNINSDPELLWLAPSVEDGSIVKNQEEATNIY